MKKLRLLLFAPLLMAFQCDEVVDITVDQLNNSGIFGGWQLNDQTIAGITNMLPIDYRLFDFYPDSNKNDDQGNFTLEEPSTNLTGTFILNEEELTIIIRRENRDDLIYNYSMNIKKDVLTFSYVESNSEFVETWVKQY